MRWTMPKGEKRNEVSRSAAKGERSPFSRFSDHLACEIFLGALGNSQGATNFPCDAANESESVGSAGVFIWADFLFGQRESITRSRLSLAKNVGLPVA